MSDKLKKHRIEEFFRSNLKSHQEDPGPELWEDVSKNIPARQNFRTFFYSRKVVLGLAAICMLPLAYYGISQMEFNDWFIEPETIEQPVPTSTPSKEIIKPETTAPIASTEEAVAPTVEMQEKVQEEQQPETETLALVTTPKSKKAVVAPFTVEKAISKKAPAKSITNTPRTKEVQKEATEEVAAVEFNKPLVIEMDDVVIELEVDEEYFKEEAKEKAVVENGQVNNEAIDRRTEAEQAATLFNDLKPEDFNPVPNKAKPSSAPYALEEAPKETLKPEIETAPVVEEQAATSTKEASSTFDSYVLNEEIKEVESVKEITKDIDTTPAKEVEETLIAEEETPTVEETTSEETSQFDDYVLNEELETEEEVEEVTLESMLAPNQKAHRVYTEEERKVKNVYPHFSYSASIEPMLSIHKAVSSDVEVADRITNLGLYAGIQVTKQFSITTGVGFRHHDLNIAGTVDLTYAAEPGNPVGSQESSYLIRPENNPEIKLRSTIINEVQNDGEDIENGDQFAVDISGSYRLKYNTIPVWLRYGFKEDKLSLNLKGGIQFHNLIGDKVRNISAGVFDAAMNGSSDRLMVDNSSLQVETTRDNFIEAGVGFGVNYALSKSIEVGIEPTVYKAVTSMFDKRPWSVGINAGVTIRVDPQR